MRSTTPIGFDEQWLQYRKLLKNAEILGKQNVRTQILKFISTIRAVVFPYAESVGTKFRKRTSSGKFF
jgi:hypothetical protein